MKYLQGCPNRLEPPVAGWTPLQWPNRPRAMSRVAGWHWREIIGSMHARAGTPTTTSNDPITTNQTGNVLSKVPIIGPLETAPCTPPMVETGDVDRHCHLPASGLATSPTDSTRGSESQSICQGAGKNRKRGYQGKRLDQNFLYRPKSRPK